MKTPSEEGAFFASPVSGGPLALVGHRTIAILAQEARCKRGGKGHHARLSP